MSEEDQWRKEDDDLLLLEEADVTRAALEQVNVLAKDLRAAARDGNLAEAEAHHDGEIWQDALQSHLLPALAEVYARAYDWQMAQFEQQAALEDGLTFATKKTTDDARENAAAYVKTVTNRLTGVADHIFADIRRELSQAIKGGETPEQMAARIDRVFAERGGNNWLGRAAVIAATETAAAINAGRMQAARKYAKDNGIKRNRIFKTWMTEKDDKVRAAHADVHGQRRSLTRPFTVAGVQMMQPGDQKAPPELTVNCRCTVRILLGGRVAAGPPGGILTNEDDDGETTEDAMTDTITEQEAITEEEAAANLEPVTVPWHGVLAPEGKMSGDRRKFAEGSLRHRDLPLPLMYQDATAEGHDGAVRVANIQGMQRAENLIRAWGVFDTSDNADEAIRQIGTEMLRGVSVDVDEADFTFEDSSGNPIDLADPLAAGDESPVMVITDGRISGATLVSIPAFQEAFVALGPPPEDWGVQTVDAAQTEQPEYAGQTRLAFENVSDKPWSDFTQADYSDEQWKRACVLDKGESAGEGKSRYGLPIREPSGTLNRNGVHAAAARFNQVDAPAEAKSSAKSKLRGAYKALGEEPPDVLAAAAAEVAMGLMAMTDKVLGLDDEFVGGQPDAGIPGHMPRVLHDYWTHGEGAAKIGWGVPGDFNRCRALLGKYVEKRMLSGLCAKLHKDAVGHWPGPGRGNSAETMDYTEGVSITEPCGCGLTASGALNDYADPMLSSLTPLTITADGKIFGHLAGWGTCHIGFSGQCITPPQSRAAYAYFRTGEVLTDDGAAVAVGHITLGTGHADAALAAGPAIEHYDDTGTVVADVAAGDDDHGIWLAGRLRPNLPTAAVDSLRAAALSGDWRRIGGSMELVAALAVNVPGFPIPRTASHVSNQRQTALVASGVVTHRDVPDDAIVAAVERAMRNIHDREVRLEKARRLAASVGRDPASRAAAARELVHGRG